MKVNLTYFRPGGKYHSEGELDTEEIQLYKIWQHIRHLSYLRNLPGLMRDHSEFIVLVDVPEHPHNHPRLIII